MSGEEGGSDAVRCFCSDAVTNAEKKGDIMKKTLKFGSFFLALLLTVQFVAPAYAAAVPPPERAPRGEWRYEYDDDFIFVSDWYEVSGQPQDGYVFHTDGYICHTPSGGSTISIGIGLATGKVISVSAQLGVAVQTSSSISTGHFVKADSKNAYKLYAKFAYEVSPYRSYYRETKKDPWKVFVDSATITPIQTQYTVMRCGPAYG